MERNQEYAGESDQPKAVGKSAVDRDGLVAGEIACVEPDCPFPADGDPGRVARDLYRMSIEQGFRDDKSGGFNLAHIPLQHADRMERLLLAMAIAMLWCHELGEYVLQQGEASRPPD